MPLKKNRVIIALMRMAVKKKIQENKHECIERIFSEEQLIYVMLSLEKSCAILYYTYKEKKTSFYIRRMRYVL